MLFKFAKKTVRGLATGTTQERLGTQSPHLPGAVVRLGRAFYMFSGGWIIAVWYTGYSNMRTQPGSGPKLVLPGKPVISSPDRPSPRAAWAQVGMGNSGGGATSVTVGNNPFPGATGSRLDQGFDLTGKSFNAPELSKIVYSSQSVAGWAGGGLVAGQVLAGSKKGRVWYMAEGISPIVQVGQTVMRGQRVGIPVSNPYNGTVGNIEAGWANPSSPTQPLAQVSSNPAGIAWDFYRWIQSMGGPKASSTGNAGKA